MRITLCCKHSVVGHAKRRKNSRGKKTAKFLAFRAGSYAPKGHLPRQWPSACKLLALRATIGSLASSALSFFACIMVTSSSLPIDLTVSVRAGLPEHSTSMCVPSLSIPLQLITGTLAHRMATRLRLYLHATAASVEDAGERGT